MRKYALGCARCLSTAASEAPRLLVPAESLASVPLHARPQPHAGPSRPSLYTKVQSKAPSQSLPSLNLSRKAQAVSIPSLAQSITSALRASNEAEARTLQRRISNERISLSPETRLEIQRAWEIYKQRKAKERDVLEDRRIKLGAPPRSRRDEDERRRRRLQLPRWLREASELARTQGGEITPQRVLDLLRHSLRAPSLPSHPPPSLEAMLEAQPTLCPALCKRRILHQYLHPDLGQPPPPLSLFSQHGIQPTALTLQLYLRALLYSHARAYHAKRYVQAFEKRYGVKPDTRSWQAIGRYAVQCWDLKVAQWCMARLDGRAVLWAYFEREGVLPTLRERDAGARGALEGRQGGADEAGREEQQATQGT